MSRECQPEDDGAQILAKTDKYSQFGAQKRSQAADTQQGVKERLGPGKGKQGHSHGPAGLDKGEGTGREDRKRRPSPQGLFPIERGKEVWRPAAGGLGIRHGKHRWLGQGRNQGGHNPEEGSLAAC